MVSKRKSKLILVNGKIYSHLDSKHQSIYDDLMRAKKPLSLTELNNFMGQEMDRANLYGYLSDLVKSGVIMESFDKSGKKTYDAFSVHRSVDVSLK